MTIKIPERNIPDKLLSILGKKRGVRIPAEIYRKNGPYAYGVAGKESFWKALLRPGKTPLPDGYIDIDDRPATKDLSD